MITSLAIPQIQRFKSGNCVSLFCRIENLSSSGSRRRGGFKWEMLLASRSTALRWGNGMSYMLSRVVILFLERINSFKVPATWLTSLGTTVSPAFSMVSDVRARSGARCISSYSPSKLLRVNILKLLPTVLNSGALCKQCGSIRNVPSPGSPSNALECICSSDLIEIYKTCKETQT